MSKQPNWHEITSRLLDAICVVRTESKSQEEKREVIQTLVDYLTAVLQQPSSDHETQVQDYSSRSRVLDMAFSALGKPDALTNEEWQNKLGHARTMLKNGSWTAERARQFLTELS